MKSFNLYIILTSFLLFSQVEAQIGIQINGNQNFTPHPSAILHMDVSNLPSGAKKGFLLPRVNLTDALDTSTILAPATGLWVYNTQTTTEPNAVQADNVYVWKTNRWERYYSREEIIDFLKPNNYYVRSFSAQIMNSSQLTSFNNGYLQVVTWQASDVVIANDPQITRNNNNEFQVNQSGIYDITGFFNYHPQISQSNATTIIFTLQANRGSGWVNLGGVTKAIELRAGNTDQSIPFPSHTVSLNNGDRLRFTFSKRSNTGSDHGSSAGISGPSNAGLKTLRISFQSEF